jgi:hypothetical protein
MQKMMYLLASQHVSGIMMPIIRRMVQNRQRLWCTTLAVLQKTRREEVVGVHLLGLVSPKVQVGERQAQRLVCPVGSVVTSVFVIRECERIYSVTRSVHLTIWNRSLSCHLLYKHIRVEIVKVKVNFALEQATKAQRGSRGIALLFL